MKLIIAYIQPHRLDEVKAELAERNVTRMTVCDVMGYGLQKGHTEIFKGKEFTVNLTKKVRLEIACNDEFVEAIIEGICIGAGTGSVGDGKIIVSDLIDIVRIRTGERGSGAI